MGFSAVLSLVLEMVSMSIPSAQILGASIVLSDAVTARPDVFGQGDNHGRALLRGQSSMMLHRAGSYTPMHYAAAAAVAAVVICVVLFAALAGVSAATGGRVSRVGTFPGPARVVATNPDILGHLQVIFGIMVARGVHCEISVFLMPTLGLLEVGELLRCGQIGARAFQSSGYL